MRMCVCVCVCESLSETVMVGPRSDCPIFDGVFEFNQRSVGGTIDGAVRLCHNKCDIAVNWSGGFHHAKKSEASGFCYVNDIVLGILELLKYFERVLYIDIDVHHGDGIIFFFCVEEAFYTTNRVCTLSFHKYGEMYFPGTGHIKDIGAKEGLNYSINVPLNDGISDDQYAELFQAIIKPLMRKYQPNAVVLQCGADSLAKDRIGRFNLSSKGHGKVVEIMKSFLVPMLVIGGGGYNIKNVARCWCYETSILADVQISPQIPYTSFSRYYGPSFDLYVEARKDMENHNTTKSLQEILQKVLENIDKIEIAPNVAWLEHNTTSLLLRSEESLRVNRDEMNPDVTMTEREKDDHITPRNEIYEDDKDQDLDLL
ncbi:hypothetical protein RFI_30461 [Reticulomyxa filosa]|uniref:histone deacetylase n=1 Tax=Reticulomyxa filosa TaxID=46433 RepID=X6M0K9_RETFI|nr:hypothetical protein RFI_30461 [Reticulomyxa filosa]|eukprot:ETO06932.1 hypothetical protein RFI_30461 [Reticulomyxa filosa]